MADTPSTNSGPQAGSSEPLITLTPKAVEMVKEALAREGVPGHALRVAVVGGGCSGFQYDLAFEEHPKEEDVVIESGGVRLLLDPTSGQHLRGVIIDYVSGLHGAGFKFLNPNAQRTCGCGSSFSA